MQRPYQGETQVIVTVWFTHAFMFEEALEKNEVE